MEFVREWSDLPQDILIRILESLNAQFYHLLLRAVCPTWRSSIPLFSVTEPLKIPTFRNLKDIGNTQLPPHDSITEKMFFHLSPLDQTTKADWIVQVEQVGRNKWSFFNPLTGNKLNLAPINSINLLDYRITELGRSFTLRFVDQISKPRTIALEKPIKKVICSFSPYNSESLVFLALYAGKLAFYKPGLEDWVYDYVKWEIDFEDIITYNGSFYAADKKGRLLMIDHHHDPSAIPKVVSIVSCPVTYPNDQALGHRYCIFLIVSDGSLYLLLKDYLGLVYKYRKTCKLIEIFRLRLEGSQGKWIKVKKSLIKSRSFFVGGDASFESSSALLRRNYSKCIYLGGYTEFCHIHNCNVEKGDFPVRYTRLFWPPPTWIFPDVDSFENCMASCVV